MILIGMTYVHTAIRNKSWQRRREWEIIRMVNGALGFAYIAEGIHSFPRTELEICCQLGNPVSLVRLVLDETEEDMAKRVVNYLNNNRNVHANYLTQPEPSVTM